MKAFGSKSSIALGMCIWARKELGQCQISQAPFGTFMFVPNGPKANTCQVAYQTVAHLASGGQSWQPFAKYLENEEQPTGW